MPNSRAESYYSSNNTLSNINASATTGKAIYIYNYASNNLSNNSNVPNYFFNNPQNVTQQGGPVPIVFGRVQRAGSVVISQGTTASKVTTGPFVLLTSPGFLSGYGGVAADFTGAAIGLTAGNNGYWSIDTSGGFGGFSSGSGAWVSNPQDGGGASFEVQFSASITTHALITDPVIFNPAPSYTALTSNQELIIDGSAMAGGGDFAGVSVTMNIRKIGTTTPVCTGTTVLTVGWDTISH